MTIRGLQVGFGDLLGPAVLADVRALQADPILARMQLYANDPSFTLKTAEESAALVQEMIDADLWPYVIIRRPEQVDHTPPGVRLEFGNEPDMRRRYGWPTVDEYAAGMLGAIARADGRNDLWIGAVSNLNEQGFAFLEALPWHRIPAWVGCSVHRYPDGDNPTPIFASRERRFRGLFQKGRKHREREIAELRRIVGPTRRLGLSEVGYHTADGQTDAEVAEHMRWERDFFTRHGFEFVIAYQMIDGPQRIALHKYGFRHMVDAENPLGPWKPVASAWFGTSAA